MREKVKEMYEKFDFDVDGSEVTMPTYSYDIEPFVFDIGAYGDDLTDVEVVEVYLDLAKEYEDYYHRTVYNLSRMKRKLEEM